ncbi:hypothetical protein C5167_024239 [Papaver somniferum]|uniref:Uncharacterized protein n=1 Tax=Papaver somniferum TaxID=3469 RepID=A0A4Y7JP07_PAPSO|nr:hypothetical protein C5167_024239 [Papaver somniferum]
MEEEPAPLIILVQGPPKVGKSLLIKSLIKYLTDQHLTDDQGPFAIELGKQRRLQFEECPYDVKGMNDAVDHADGVLLLIDASHGFKEVNWEDDFRMCHTKNDLRTKCLTALQNV